MLIANTGQSLVVMNLRTGEQVQLPPGLQTPLADSKIQYIDDSAVLISLFNAGVLVAYTDAGAAYPGFPTSARPADSKVIPLVDQDYAAAVVGAGPSFRNRDCVILGDSIAQENIEQSATAITMRPRWFNIANALLGQRLNLVNNAGVSGERIAATIQRIPASVTNLGVGFGQNGAVGSPPALPPGVLAFSPGFVFVLPPFNDIYGDGASFEYVTGFLEREYGMIIASGAILCAMTLMPCSSSTVGFSTATSAVHVRVNEWIRSYCAWRKNAILIDAFAALMKAGPTAATISVPSTCFRDGNQHPNNLGGYYVGKSIYDALVNIVPPVNVLPTSNAEEYTLDPSINWLLPNPLLAGSDATITTTGYSGVAPNTLANANFVRGGTPTIVLSRPDNPNGYGKDLQFEFTPNADNDSAELRFPSQHSRVVVGGQYIVVCQYSVTGLSGADLTSAANFAGAQLYLQYNNGTTNYFSWANAWSSTDEAYPENHTMTLMTRPLIIPSGGTPTTFRPNFSMYSSGGTGGFRVRLSRPNLLRVG